MDQGSDQTTRITVAVPTFNGARHLRDALQSITRSSCPFDLLVVDDRSDDATLGIAREVVGDRGRVEQNTERLGLAGNWNRCVDLSRTPLVAIFHQDDVMLAEHLETHLRAYQNNSELGWVASAADVIDDAGKPVSESVVERGGLGPHNRLFANGLGVDALAITNPLRCSAVTINRAAHAEVGGFDPSYRYAVDWDFWLRVADARPVAWRSRTTVAIRWHHASETHRFATGTDDLEETARLLHWVDHHLDRYTEFYPEWRRKADHHLARAYLNRAHVGFNQGNPALARRALRHSLRLDPSRMLARLASDPRLVAQMAAAWLLPGWVSRRVRSS